MKKFFVLLQKEIRELITLRMFLPIVLMAVIFAGIGQMVGSEKNKLGQPWTLSVVDQSSVIATANPSATSSNSTVAPTTSSANLSQELFQALAAKNIKVQLLKENDPQKAVAIAQNQGSTALLVIPKNFAEAFQHDQKIHLQLFTFMRGFSLGSTFALSRIETLTNSINDFLSNRRLQSHVTNIAPDLLKNPAIFDHFTVLGERNAEINFGEVMGFIQSQTTFVPVILFLVIVLAAQMVASAIASEKENKTLEILLSSPVDRKSIIFAKILAAALVALLLSGIYIVGWSSSLGSLSGGAIFATNPALTQALQTLGVVVGPFGYFLLGVSLFLSILLALAIAIILGIMAEDVKSVQAITMPLIVLIMIPYFLTLFMDLNTAPLWLRLALSVIPFSHTFLAMQNVLMQNFMPIFYGIIYQSVVAFLCIVIASKIFTSDHVLTLQLKRKKEATQKV